MSGRMMWYAVMSIFVFFFMVALKVSGLISWHWLWMLSPLWTFWIVLSVYIIYKIAKESWNGR